MSKNSIHNTELIKNGIVFQEHNVGVYNTRKFVAGRCKYLINREVNPITLDESKLTYKEGMFPID